MSVRLARGRRWSFAEFEGSAGGGCSRAKGGTRGRAGRSTELSQRPRRAGCVRIGVGIECVRSSWPWSNGRLLGSQRRFGDVRARRRATGAIAEPEFDILAELLQQRLEPLLRVLQSFDPAVGLPKFFLETVDAHHEPGRVVGISRSVRNVGGRRSLTVEDIELCLSRRRERDAGDEHSGKARAKRRRHWKDPDWLRLPGPYARHLSILSRGRSWRAAACTFFSTAGRSV